MVLRHGRRHLRPGGRRLLVRLRSALDHALDQGLRYRLIGLREFLEDVEPGGDREIASRLSEISRLGELYQAFDADGELIAQSHGLARHGVPKRPPQELGFAIRYGAGGTPEFPLRLAWQRVTIGAHTLVLGVADPQRKFEGVLGAFTTVLLLSTPAVLALATGCGVWLGRRALAPVARVTDDARAISESNLSARLAVPGSRDELQQLSETLNDMLGRIERSCTAPTSAQTARSAGAPSSPSGCRAPEKRVHAPARTGPSGRRCGRHGASELRGRSRRGLSRHGLRPDLLLRLPARHG